MNIVVSVGDPSGIGPELFARLIRTEPHWLEKAAFRLTGPPKLWRYLGLEEHPALQFCGQPVSDPLPTPGKPCPLGAKIQSEALLQSLDLMKESKGATLLTLPVNKEQLNNYGLSFLGHTDYFRSIFPNHKITMAFRSDDHWLALATDHIPLWKVPSQVQVDQIVASGRHLHEASQKPLVICGLNPHAGEGGFMGKEELELGTAIDQLRSLGISARGFVAADSVFAHWNSAEAVLALYHDQGLGPFKALFRGQSCQISLGLPFRRVSPDHGTAYDLAGTKQASPGSLRQAFIEALRPTRPLAD